MRRSAWGEGVKPASRIFAKTKASIGLRIHPFSSETRGSAGRVGATKAQCRSYGAPSAIHRRRMDFSRSESVSLLSGGGIISSGSEDSMRSISALSSGFPGTTA